MILQNLDDLEKDLKTSPGRRFYLVMGPEMYLCRHAVDLIKNSLLNREASAIDFSEYSAKDTPVDKILETANTFPMVSNRRVVLVTELEKLPESQHQKLLNSLESLLPQTMLILVAEEIDRRKKLFKSIRDKGCIAEFTYLKGPALKRWVTHTVRRKGYRVSPATAEKILSLVGSDLQSLEGELEKLFLFTGKEKEITEQSVDTLVLSSRQHGIFELIDAIGMRDRASALASLENLLNTGEYPLVILAMLARHSRQVLIVKECFRQGMNQRQAGNAAQIPPFVLDKFVRQARVMDPETVRKMHTGLSDIDRRLKSSSVDARTLLEVFICALV